MRVSWLYRKWNKAAYLFAKALELFLLELLVVNLGGRHDVGLDLRGSARLHAVVESTHSRLIHLLLFFDRQGSPFVLTRWLLLVIIGNWLGRSRRRRPRRGWIGGDV